MPIQKKKKKKPVKPKAKTPTVSQKVSQVVKINIGDVKPKPRRRAAPRKPPAGGGGGGGFPPAPPSGLVQQVQAPQVTQDVLQQSKELREIVNKLQTSPAQQTLRGQEAGGQPENPLNPRAFVTRQELDDRSEMNLQRQAAAQFNIYQKIRDVERGLLESYAMEEARRDEDMSDISSQTSGLNDSFTMAETVKTRHSHALDPGIPEAQAAALHEPEEPPVAQLVPGAGRGRGAGLTEEQRQMIRDDIVASGMSVNEYNLSGRNPIGTGAISRNTLNSLFRGGGGLKGYKERQGI
jgi:hypothetical protein